MSNTNALLPSLECFCVRKSKNLNIPPDSSLLLSPTTRHVSVENGRHIHFIDIKKEIEIPDFSIDVSTNESTWGWVSSRRRTSELNLRDVFYHVYKTTVTFYLLLDEGESPPVLPFYRMLKQQEGSVLQKKHVIRNDHLRPGIVEITLSCDDSVVPIVLSDSERIILLGKKNVCLLEFHKKFVLERTFRIRLPFSVHNRWFLRDLFLFGYSDTDKKVFVWHIHRERLIGEFEIVGVLKDLTKKMQEFFVTSDLQRMIFGDDSGNFYEIETNEYFQRPSYETSLWNSPKEDTLLGRPPKSSEKSTMKKEPSTSGKDGEEEDSLGKEISEELSDEEFEDDKEYFERMKKFRLGSYSSANLQYQEVASDDYSPPEESDHDRKSILKLGGLLVDGSRKSPHFLSPFPSRTLKMKQSSSRKWNLCFEDEGKWETASILSSRETNKNDLSDESSYDNLLINPKLRRKILRTHDFFHEDDDDLDDDFGSGDDDQHTFNKKRSFEDDGSFEVPKIHTNSFKVSRNTIEKIVFTDDYIIIKKFDNIYMVYHLLSRDFSEIRISSSTVGGSNSDFSGRKRFDDEDDYETVDELEEDRNDFLPEIESSMIFLEFFNDSSFRLVTNDFSVYSLLLGHSKKQILMNVLMFENNFGEEQKERKKSSDTGKGSNRGDSSIDKALKLCRLNGWDETDLLILQMEIGLENRQIGVIRTVLESINNYHQKRDGKYHRGRNYQRSGKKVGREELRRLRDEEEKDYSYSQLEIRACCILADFFQNGFVTKESDFCVLFINTCVFYLSSFIDRRFRILVEKNKSLYLETQSQVQRNYEQGSEEKIRHLVKCYPYYSFNLPYLEKKNVNKEKFPEMITSDLSLQGGNYGNYLEKCLQKKNKKRRRRRGGDISIHEEILLLSDVIAYFRSHLRKREIMKHRKRTLQSSSEKKGAKGDEAEKLEEQEVLDVEEDAVSSGEVLNEIVFGEAQGRDIFQRWEGLEPEKLEEIQIECLEKGNISLCYSYLKYRFEKEQSSSKKKKKKKKVYSYQHFKKDAFLIVYKFFSQNKFQTGVKILKMMGEDVMKHMKEIAFHTLDSCLRNQLLRELERHNQLNKSELELTKYVSMLEQQYTMKKLHSMNDFGIEINYEGVESEEGSGTSPKKKSVVRSSQNLNLSLDWVRQWSKKTKERILIDFGFLDSFSQCSKLSRLSYYISHFQVRNALDLVNHSFSQSASSSESVKPRISDKIVLVEDGGLEGGRTEENEEKSTPGLSSSIDTNEFLMDEEIGKLLEKSNVSIFMREKVLNECAKNHRFINLENTSFPLLYQRLLKSKMLFKYRNLDFHLYMIKFAIKRNLKSDLKQYCDNFDLWNRFKHSSYVRKNDKLWVKMLFLAHDNEVKEHKRIYKLAKLNAKMIMNKSSNEFIGLNEILRYDPYIGLSMMLYLPEEITLKDTMHRLDYTHEYFISLSRFEEAVRNFSTFHRLLFPKTDSIVRPDSPSSAIPDTPDTPLGGREGEKDDYEEDDNSSHEDGFVGTSRENDDFEEDDESNLYEISSTTTPPQRKRRNQRSRRRQDRKQKPYQQFPSQHKRNKYLFPFEVERGNITPNERDITLYQMLSFYNSEQLENLDTVLQTRDGKVIDCEVSVSKASPNTEDKDFSNRGYSNQEFSDEYDFQKPRRPTQVLMIDDEDDLDIGYFLERGRAMEAYHCYLSEKREEYTIFDSPYFSYDSDKLFEEEQTRVRSRQLGKKKRKRRRKGKKARDELSSSTESSSSETSSDELDQSEDEVGSDVGRRSYHQKMILRSQQLKNNKRGEVKLEEGEKSHLYGAVRSIGLHNLKKKHVLKACQMFLDLLDIPSFPFLVDMKSAERCQRYCIKYSEKKIIEMFLNLYPSYDVVNLQYQQMRRRSSRFPKQKEEDVSTTNLEVHKKKVLKLLETATHRMLDHHKVSSQTKKRFTLESQIFEGLTHQDNRDNSSFFISPWILVRKFCEIHQFPDIFMSHLKFYAKRNQWISFLLEAQDLIMEDFANYELVRSIIFKHFSNDALKEHLTIVLDYYEREYFDETTSDTSSNASSKKMRRRRRRRRRRGSSFGSGSSSYAKRKKEQPLVKLITILNKIYNIKDVKKQRSLALEQSIRMKQPLLAVCATCFVEEEAEEEETEPGGSKVEKKRKKTLKKLEKIKCLTYFVYAYGLMDIPPMLEPFRKETLSNLIINVCKKNDFMILMNGYQIFYPTAPILKFLKFYSSFMQRKYVDAKKYLTLYKRQLDRIHHRNQEDVVDDDDFSEDEGEDSDEDFSSEDEEICQYLCFQQIPHKLECTFERNKFLSILKESGYINKNFERLYQINRIINTIAEIGCEINVFKDKDRAILEKLLRKNAFKEARMISNVLQGKYHDQVTKGQAYAFITQMRNSPLWEYEHERKAVWMRIDQLFKKHKNYKSHQAATFFVAQVRDYHKSLKVSDIILLLTLASSWYKKSKIIEKKSLSILDNNIALLKYCSDNNNNNNNNGYDSVSDPSKLIRASKVIRVSKVYIRKILHQIFNIFLPSGIKMKQREEFRRKKILSRNVNNEQQQSMMRNRSRFYHLRNIHPDQLPSDEARPEQESREDGKEVEEEDESSLTDRLEMVSFLDKIIDSLLGQLKLKEAEELAKKFGHQSKNIEIVKTAIKLARKEIVLKDIDPDLLKKMKEYKTTMSVGEENNEDENASSATTTEKENEKKSSEEKKTKTKPSSKRSRMDNIEEHIESLSLITLGYKSKGARRYIKIVSLYYIISKKLNLQYDSVYEKDKYEVIRLCLTFGRKMFKTCSQFFTLHQLDPRRASKVSAEVLFSSFVDLGHYNVEEEEDRNKKKRLERRKRLRRLKKSATVSTSKKQKKKKATTTQKGSSFRIPKIGGLGFSSTAKKNSRRRRSFLDKSRKKMSFNYWGQVKKDDSITTGEEIGGSSSSDLNTFDDEEEDSSFRQRMMMQGKNNEGGEEEEDGKKKKPNFQFVVSRAYVTFSFKVFSEFAQICKDPSFLGYELLDLFQKHYEGNVTSRDFLRSSSSTTSLDDTNYYSDDGKKSLSLMNYVKLIIKTNWCFELSTCLKGQSKLVEVLNETLIKDLKKNDSFKPLIKLITSLRNSGLLTDLFEYLISKNSLEILLSKNVVPPKEENFVKYALLDFVEKKFPQQSAAYVQYHQIKDMIYLKFRMFKELGEMHFMHALSKLGEISVNVMSVTKQRFLDSFLEPLKIIIHRLHEASNFFSNGGCLSESHKCIKLCSLVEIQMELLVNKKKYNFKNESIKEWWILDPLIMVNNTASPQKSGKSDVRSNNTNLIKRRFKKKIKRFLNEHNCFVHSFVVANYYNMNSLNLWNEILFRQCVIYGNLTYFDQYLSHGLPSSLKTFKEIANRFNHHKNAKMKKKNMSMSSKKKRSRSSDISNYMKRITENLRRLFKRCRNQQHQLIINQMVNHPEWSEDSINILDKPNFGK